MVGKEFVSKFGEVAKQYGFAAIQHTWYLERGEFLVVLVLQKSNFGNFYYLNVKVFVQDLFGFRYEKSRSSFQQGATAFRRQPKEFDFVFDLNNDLEDEDRLLNIQALFQQFICPFAEKALTRVGLLSLSEHEEIFLGPVVIEALQQLGGEGS